jgi:hypothetical protein
MILYALSSTLQLMAAIFFFRQILSNKGFLRYIAIILTTVNIFLLFTNLYTAIG